MFDEVYGIWGAGLVHRDTNYRAVDASTDPAPIIMGGIGDLSIEANRAAYTLYRDGTWFGSAVGLYRSNQSLDKDDARPLGIGERKPALEVGAQIGRRLPFGFTGRLAATRDISGAHASAEYDLQFYRHDDFGPVRLLSSIGGQYLSSGLTDYYYATEAYKPDAALALAGSSLPA